MNYNVAKLAGGVLLCVVLVVAIIVDSSNTEWAVPLLTAIAAYAFGNARLTGNKPIVERTR